MFLGGGIGSDFLAGRMSVPKVWELFPRRVQLKASELLRQLQWLDDDAFLLVVVAHFHIATEREVFAERMSFESVIGEDPSQVGMVGEENAIHVPYLPLIPVGRFEHIVARFDRRELICVCLDAYPRIVSETVKIIH